MSVSEIQNHLSGQSLVSVAWLAQKQPPVSLVNECVVCNVVVVCVADLRRQPEMSARGGGGSLLLSRPLKATLAASASSLSSLDDDPRMLGGEFCCRFLKPELPHYYFDHLASLSRFCCISSHS